MWLKKYDVEQMVRRDMQDDVKTLMKNKSRGYKYGYYCMNRSHTLKELSLSWTCSLNYP